MKFTTDCPPGRARPHIRGVTGLALSMMLATLGISIPYVALPELASALQVSFRSAQWVVLTYLLSVTVLVVAVGLTAQSG
ncbi:hypothetical protein DL237_06490 [Pseudooceanicola sediminis]|uniref:MFS transporter n=1 Tax=Pseudooceanicola sediminis TaxID=2211117 RepID=A0A399JAW9_9RHOB|nr:hypothetical protein [Pseudooceanicola sediminis]KAA2317432.1 MFS transporter [Puniceibacterium sp. HSS470]RII39786.1 hypothetical protein DL237_06490 [Pseudooceanicola sediminis]|tara:strand:+ start:13497 stop:13736 length:240 start_codon:yes stop_codon:yes gene_type:complete